MQQYGGMGYGHNTEGGEFMSVCMYWDFFLWSGGHSLLSQELQEKKQQHGILGKLASFWEESLR